MKRLQYDAKKISDHIRKEKTEKVEIENMRPGELLSRLEQFPVAYFPLGTIEWHGRQNPLGCDTIKARELCKSVAQKIGGVVMPSVYYAADKDFESQEGTGYGMDGISGMVLPGSFYQIDLELLKKYLINGCANCFNRGFEMVVLISGHNPPIQEEVMKEVSEYFKNKNKKVIYSMECNCVMDESNRMCDHAGGYETSMMLHYNEELVNMKANEGYEQEVLGIGTSYPLETSSKEIGQKQASLQIAGMSMWVIDEYKRRANNG